MFVFKDIDKSATVIEQNVVNYTHNFNTSSAGINSIKIISGSTNNKYWQSLNVLFYTSGSPVYNESKFGTSVNNLSINQPGKQQHLTKFHGYQSSSLITIPQQYYGEKIQPKSFIFTDLNNTDNDGNNPIIVDDGKGNLYSTNAHHSQSSTSTLSSIENYVGNIFYNKGLAIITETGSWSGSVNYSDLATNYTLKLDSTNSITTYEYDISIQPNEYNYSTNYTLRSPISGSLKLTTPYLAREFTGSAFSPYITTINLYQKGMLNEPVIQVRLPKPIKKSNKISTTFKIKLDM